MAMIQTEELICPLPPCFKYQSHYQDHSSSSAHHLAAQWNRLFTSKQMLLSKIWKWEKEEMIQTLSEKRPNVPCWNSSKPRLKRGASNLRAEITDFNDFYLLQFGIHSLKSPLTLFFIVFLTFIHPQPYLLVKLSSIFLIFDC